MSTAPIRVTHAPLPPTAEGPEGSEPIASGPATSSTREKSRAAADGSFLSVAQPLPRPSEAPSAPRERALAETPGRGAAEMSQRTQGTAATLERITERLSRSVLDPAITDADVRAVQRELSRLSGPALAGTLHALEGRGLLTTLLAEQDPGVRREFVALLEDARLFHRQPSTPVKGILSPPDGPGLIEVSRDAPESLRRLGHQENLRIAAGYDAQRAEYVERYIGKVNEARTHGELSLLGPPVGRKPTLMYGVPDFGLAARSELSDLLGRNDLARPHQAWTNRKAILFGKTPPGHGNVEAQAALSVHGATAAATLVVAENGPSFRADLGMKGRGLSFSLTPAQLLGDLAAAAASSPEQILAETGAKIGTGGTIGQGPSRVGVEVASEGTHKLVLGRAEVTVNALTGAVSAGVFEERRLTAASSVTAGVRVNAQLADPRNVAAIANGKGLPPPPPELLAQSPWNTLPPERQSSLRGEGVRPVYWDSLMPQLQSFVPR